jgi:hypothetical protein
MEPEPMDAPQPEQTFRDLLDSYVFGSRERTTKAFDADNADLLNEAIGSIGKILGTQVILFAHGAHVVGLRFDAFALVRTALDTLVSALHLARQRAFIEAACLVRSALESGCTALHISQDPDAYENFLKHTYHSTKSISAVKKEIPVLGEIWGALSQIAVHVSRRGHGPKWERDETSGDWAATVDFDFQARPAVPEKDHMSLLLISLAAEIVAKIQELSLFDEDPANPGWRRAPGIPLICSTGTGDAIESLHRRVLSLGDTVRNSQRS